MAKITKLSQLDPGIVELIKSDNDQDLALANNLMKALNIKLSGKLLDELNSHKIITKPVESTTRESIGGGKYTTIPYLYSIEIRARKYFYDMINSSQGLKRYQDTHYRFYKEEIDNFLRNEQKSME